MGEKDKDDLINVIEESGSKLAIPEVLPMMPVRDVVIFSDMLLPLFVDREKSIAAIEEALTEDRYIFIITQKDPGIENPVQEDLYKVGTVSRILRILKLPDGRLKALVHGISNGRILLYEQEEPFYSVKVEVIEEHKFTKHDNLRTEALIRNVREHAEKILALRGDFSTEVSSILNSIDSPGKMADLVASNLKLKIDEAQSVIEVFDPIQRLEIVNDLLSREVELSTMQAKIQSEVKEEISKSQKDYFLREQVRVIHKELGELDEKSQEISDYKAKIENAKMSKEAFKEAEKQLKRLEQMHTDSSEASVIRTYLDCLIDIPWSKSTKDIINILKAKEILNQDCYGLYKVKDRILEYLSVRKLNPKTKGPILCFVGPPGVGKTSLGRVIAKAMKRKFIRISLGGVRDEAEIRGHRRTYIGALPGRILQGLKQCNSNNPVFMMDEIDKIGSDFRGDPSSALLEALDPEQNYDFSDHYLNIPFDLSRVMFILTANVTDTIPFALLDRMEIIHLSGYTEDEKRKIAEIHLLPRQISENGLRKRHISISSSAIENIIREYTSEAGLRNLERELGTLCRKVARRIAEGEKGPFKVMSSNLGKFLGPPKYYPELDQEHSQVGLSTGLAWTQVGGEVLYIEVTLITGKSDIIMTGQLGDVMQESARAAISYIRSNLDYLEIEDSVFENKDIHIHVPAGAIPKDGPSAGIAIATAIVSALKRCPVDKNIAMTGEISLRGRVMPIGGLREKVLGALRAGIKTVIIPEKNKRDIVEIPKNILKKINFVMVKNMNEVLNCVLKEKE